MKLTELENRVFDADDKFRKCERKKCKPQVQAWSLQSKQILKETYGRINIETASATEWKKTADDFKASLEISNANVEKVKCAISKCEADMWELLDLYIKMFKTSCKAKKNTCDLVLEAMNIKKSKNISECHRFINKTFSSKVFQ
jgi:hypothetical protein